MDALDWVLLIGSFFVLIFTIIMDVLLVREWLKKRRDRQAPADPSDK